MALMPHLNERQVRLAAAVEARSLGYGGVSAVAEATGLARGTIHRGLEELKDPPRTVAHEQVRAPGGGRKSLAVQHPRILKRLKALVESSTRKDPRSPLLWTCQSTRQLAIALSKQQTRISPDTVGRLLADMGYRLQANVKTLEEGVNHPDRGRQFRYLNERVRRFMQQGEPVIAVDTRKKEVSGQARHHGWVDVERDRDTASVAVGSIRRWWRAMGSDAYPRARQLLICADSGGSSGYRLRLWKVELQALADDLGFAVTVCHLPPGTSKWNKVEHQLVSHISMNWRGRPPVSHEVVVTLIAATMTKAGLKARRAKRKYPVKVKIADDPVRPLNIEPHAFHGDRNFTIRPRTPRTSQ